MTTVQPLDRQHCLFINCPFDTEYQPMLDAVVFAVTLCGLKVRSALEVSDSGEMRLSKIVRLIESARFSIHDLSRIELDSVNLLPRFNMPLELGIALGMKMLGRKSLRDHVLLVTDTERYRYQKYASDLAGVDISAHGGDPAKAIACVRGFLATHRKGLPTADVINLLWKTFEAEILPLEARKAKQTLAELSFTDRLSFVEDFVVRARVGS